MCFGVAGQRWPAILLYIYVKPLYNYVWLCRRIMLYSGIIKKLNNMKVKDMIKLLGTMDPEMIVLGEYDMDGDDFMVKVHIGGIREDNGMDDCGNSDDEETMYCVIRLDTEGEHDEDDM
jgi:hypothetical protein